MKFLRVLLLFAAFGFIPACGVLPQYRIGQKSVPPPVQKPPQQVEAERQAAEYLTHVDMDPKEAEDVADGLSESLGKPDKPLKTANKEEIKDSAAEALKVLNAGMVKLQKQIDAQNKFLTKYAGTKLEGTGFDLAGPGMFALIVGLIALGVLCPPALTVMFFILRRVKAAAGIVVSEVENASKDPELKAAVGKIKTNVATAMQKHKQPTTALKSVITNLKQ